MRPFTAALCAVVLVGQFLLGCGNGDDRPAGRADYVDALTEDLREPEGGLALDEKPARCLAAAVVDAIGIDRLEGLSPGEVATESLADLGISVTEATTARLEEAFGACPWLRQILADTFAAELGAAVSDEGVDCLVGYAQEDVNARFVEYLTGEGSVHAFEREVQDALSSGLAECPDANADFLIAAIAHDGDVRIQPGGEECIRQLFRSRPDNGAAAASESEAEAAALYEELQRSCGQFLRRVRSD